MPSSSRLSSLFRSGRIFSSKQSPPSSLPVTSAASTSKAESPSSSSDDSCVVPASLLRLTTSPKPSSQSKKNHSHKWAGNVSISSLNLGESESDYLVKKGLQAEIYSVLVDDKSHCPNATAETVLDIPWFQQFNPVLSSRQKEVSRERKHKWIHKTTQDRRFRLLIKACTQKLGTDTAMKVFEKLRRETGIKEYNALIDVCLQKARATDDDDIALQETYKAYQLVSSMKETGHQIKNATYGPLLTYLAEMQMEEGFYALTELVMSGSAESDLKLRTYEMLLHINLNNDKKIQQLCDNAIACDDEEKHDLIGNYLVTLSQSASHTEDVSRLLDKIDLISVSSKTLLEQIFESLGRQQRESTVEKFLLEIKNQGKEAEDMAQFIFHYVANLPDLLVEDVILKCKNLITKFEVAPSSTFYGELIKHCCKFLEVYVALDVADEMGEAGLTLPVEVLNNILHACEGAYEYTVVQRVNSLIHSQNLSPNIETFRCLISLASRTKDFSAAYDMLHDLEKFDLKPSVSLYNTIMLGYFRDKNVYGAKMVLSRMEAAGVKPDSQTFSYLISNCDSEEDIIKYYEEIKQGGLQLTKQVYMSLVSAYTACGQFEKAKQVINEIESPFKNLDEIKSALVNTLASNDKIADALDIYDSIKQHKGNIDSKAVLSIIESLHREDGRLDRMLEVLKELEDASLERRLDGYCRVIYYCVRFNHISVAIDLLKQIEELIRGHEMGMDFIIDEIFAIVPDGEPAVLRSGLDLYLAVKKELGVSPSRKVYDFLLSACVNAKDLNNALFIWREYQNSGLPFNVLSYLRMYQALMACGDYTTAKAFRNKIPKDDYHVRCLVEAYDKLYVKAASHNTKTGKKKALQKNEDDRK